MSDNAQDINNLKRQAKKLEDEASVYEFGFEIPPKKKLNEIPKPVFAVLSGKNRNRRQSAFIETSILESPKKTNPNAKEIDAKKSDVILINVPTDEQIISEQNGNGITSHVIDHNLTESVIQNTDENFIEIPLNAGIDDNNAALTEPLLFRNNYFKIVNQQANYVSAMCITCGLDENNKPKTILKSHENVSSNFLSHLKVIHE